MNRAHSASASTLPAGPRGKEVTNEQGHGSARAAGRFVHAILLVSVLLRAGGHGRDGEGADMFVLARPSSPLLLFLFGQYYLFFRLGALASLLRRKM